MGGRQAKGELTADIDNLLGGEPSCAFEERCKVLTAHQFHREEDFAGSFADVEHAADRWVRNLTRQPHFVENARPRLRRGRPNHLQRHRCFKDQIFGTPDVAHSAAPDSRDHPVSIREHVPGDERVR